MGRAYRRKRAGIKEEIRYLFLCNIANKKVCCGKGRASKDEVKEAVISSGFLSSSVHAVTEHDYDSISVGICHIKMTQKVVAILRSESW